MAHSVSAKKRIRQTVKRELRGKHYRTRVRSLVKAIEKSIVAGNSKKAKEQLPELVATVQRVSGKGIMHKNRAATLISRIASRVASLS